MPYPPGIYTYKQRGWTKPTFVEVTETHVRRSPAHRPIPLEELPADAEMRPLTLEEIPRVPEKYFVITINGHPGVIIPLLGPIPRLPTQVLDLYSEQYAIDRKTLGWAIVREIPMPVPEGETE